MLTIQFKTSNAAFDGNYTEEVTHILQEIAQSLADNGPSDTRVSIRDSNGNTIGHWIEDGKS